MKSEKRANKMGLKEPGTETKILNLKFPFLQPQKEYLFCMEKKEMLPKIMQPNIQNMFDFG